MLFGLISLTAHPPSEPPPSRMGAESFLELQMTDVTFVACHATERGGGLTLLRSAAPAMLSNVSFLNCLTTAAGEPAGGGGLYLHNNAEVRIENSLFVCRRLECTRYVAPWLTQVIES